MNDSLLIFFFEESLTTTTQRIAGEYLDVGLAFGLLTSMRFRIHIFTFCFLSSDAPKF